MQRCPEGARCLAHSTLSGKELPVIWSSQHLPCTVAAATPSHCATTDCHHILSLSSSKPTKPACISSALLLTAIVSCCSCNRYCGYALSQSPQREPNADRQSTLGACWPSAMLLPTLLPPVGGQAVAATTVATRSLLQDARSRFATRMESSRLCRYSGMTSPVMYFPALKRLSQ